MTDAAIKKALEVAKRRVCICDGECFETRHGMMQGPCEAEPAKAAAAIAAFFEELPPGLIRWGTDGAGYDPDNKPTLRQMAAAVERAAGGE